MDIEEISKTAKEVLEFSQSEDVKKLSKEELEELNGKITECVKLLESIKEKL